MLVYWLPFGVSFAFAGASVVLGVIEPAVVSGCAKASCNWLRTFEWETMSAGLFGLSGGFLVLIASKQQINAMLKSTKEQMAYQAKILNDQKKRIVIDRLDKCIELREYSKWFEKELEILSGRIVHACKDNQKTNQERGRAVKEILKDFDEKPFRLRVVAAMNAIETPAEIRSFKVVLLEEIRSLFDNTLAVHLPDTDREVKSLELRCTQAISRLIDSIEKISASTEQEERKLGLLYGVE
ncbi:MULTISPECIES: hypothetical protein [Thalassospira]|uniref:Uncharacterized protein n=2 Tax=Thalassospira TaxID=168934 RepID=A0A367W8X4_9PROT|nr:MULTISPECIES: hypothetical protein [Thalassospira]MDG4718130.1 hypothetical protein [Thalassospira sp. FZY0004]RCK37896.1 hypothetical protein TH19_07695 [Thalassospira profundimaris]